MYNLKQKFNKTKMYFNGIIIKDKSNKNKYAMEHWALWAWQIIQILSNQIYVFVLRSYKSNLKDLQNYF